MMRSIDSKVLFAALLLAGCGAAAEGSAPPATDAAPPDATPAAAEPSAAPDEGAPADGAAPAEPPPEKEGIATPRKDDDSGSLQQRLMKSHFNETAEIRDAVISGKINDAVRPAAALAKMEEVGTLPKQWHASVEQLQVASRRIRESSDLQEIAAATADIGRACASCHASVSGPKIEVGSPPSEGTALVDRMKRHMWATERLWEGIYGPSDAAWKAGASALELDPFPKDQLSKGGVHALSAAATFTKLTKGVGALKTGDARADRYAQLLSTCAPCHEAMGRAK